ncbi:hypothetical protein A4X09_0g6138 [Tilletia walkeri]|uniref:Uncharacterized protein n=1 Tax=Tilletia walkeri TaxID=117179 RepID=A0A8X7N492_9BASI|nr:hypothetical protein A4X09_0g6138 [Tilletia walkeri]
MTPADLVASLNATGEYIGGDGVKKRLDSAKLEERGRFMITTASGEVEEMRWSYTGKGRSAYGFVNGKTGNAYPPHWVAPGSRPTRIEIGDSNVPGMRRKRVIKGGDSYPCNVFKCEAVIDH